MTTADIGYRVGELLFQAGAIHCNRSQPYILAAGWASPVYIDVRLLFGQHAMRKQVAELAYEYLETHFPPDTFDAVVGAETAGMPFATSLADRAKLDFRYVRKRSLGVGRDAQVEGGPVSGLRTLLVDDLTTDASSKLAFARGLRSANAVVEHVLCIFFHDVFPGARQRLSDVGLQLHSLAGWNDLLRVEASRSLLAEDRAEIERFLADPISWSAKHGGRLAIDSRR